MLSAGVSLPGRWAQRLVRPAPAACILSFEVRESVRSHTHQRTVSQSVKLLQKQLFQCLSCVLSFNPIATPAVVLQATDRVAVERGYSVVRPLLQ